MLNHGFAQASLLDRGGKITYSTDHRLIGSAAAGPAHVREALAGTVRGDVTVARRRRRAS